MTKGLEALERRKERNRTRQSVRTPANSGEESWVRRLSGCVSALLPLTDGTSDWTANMWPITMAGHWDSSALASLMAKPSLEGNPNHSEWRCGQRLTRTKMTRLYGTQHQALLPETGLLCAGFSLGTQSRPNHTHLGNKLPRLDDDGDRGTQECMAVVLIPLCPAPPSLGASR